MRSLRTVLIVLAAVFLFSGVSKAQDAASSAPFKEGETITFDKISKLKDYVPKELWDHRDFVFYEGMKLQIGPAFRHYPLPPEYDAATERFKGQPKLGPKGSLEGHTAGQPFPMDQIDCKGDPNAGIKIMWNFDYQWEGDGNSTSYMYTYWDRGEQLPLYYEGTAKVVILSARIEKELLDKQGGDLFKNEKRKYAFGVEVDAPFDARGIQVMTYRYKSSDGEPGLDTTRNDDTWVYVPTLRRVRRISTAQRTDAISGTDFTFDDIASFGGIVAQYKWECVGEVDILAPVNTMVKGYPYDKNHNFGPYGLSFADDRWELRHAYHVRFYTGREDHPYHHKDIYIDKESAMALYSFAYDQKEELWKIIYHNSRWSEEDPDYYPGWEGVPAPNDLKHIADVILNVQTGTGNRIEFWDAAGTPLASRGKIRRYIDVGRLTKGH